MTLTLFLLQRLQKLLQKLNSLREFSAKQSCSLSAKRSFAKRTQNS